MFWRQVFRGGHHLGSAGMIGAYAACLALVTFAPEPSASLEAYAASRASIAIVCKWILVPSLLLVLVSGLAALGANPAYHDAGWAWLKALTGLAMFEGTLLTVDSTARQAAELTAAAAASGMLDTVRLESLISREQGGLWGLLAIAIANVVLGVWRPRLSRSKANS